MGRTFTSSMVNSDPMPNWSRMLRRPLLVTMGTTPGGGSDFCGRWSGICAVRTPSSSMSYDSASTSAYSGRSMVRTIVLRYSADSLSSRPWASSFSCLFSVYRRDHETRWQCPTVECYTATNEIMPFLSSELLGFLFLFFPYFFVSGPYARLSWPSRQLLSAR